MGATGPQDTPGVRLGVRRGPFTTRFDGDLLRRYGAATASPHAVVLEGRAAHPVAVVLGLWEALTAGRESVVGPGIEAAAAGGVHGEHDIVLHRPLVPGEELRIWVDGHGARPAGGNALVTLRFVAIDDRDEVVAEQWWTTVFLGATCAPVGRPAPDHHFPAEARSHPVGTFTADVDADMARRYAEVSGDWSPHHFEPSAARAGGFDRVFIHGLCTMALCGHAVVELVAGGDPERVRRLAVRFAAPTFLGERLRVSVHDAGPLGHAFEAHSAGVAVITHGRAELR